MDTERETPDLPVEILQAGASLGLPTEAAIENGGGPWHPETLGDAAWAMGKLREAQHVIDGVDALAATYHARIDAWRQEAIRPAARTVEFFTGHLEGFAIHERESTGAATLHLPSGRVETRPGREKTVIDDTDALIAWLKANQPDAVKVTESVLVSEIRCASHFEDGAVWGKLVASGGEIIPGVHVERIPVVAKVKPS